MFSGCIFAVFIVRFFNETYNVYKLRISHVIDVLRQFLKKNFFTSLLHLSRVIHITIYNCFFFLS